MRTLVIDQGEPKYLNSPETPVLFHKRRELYGLYQVRQALPKRSSRIVVVEGYMDVVGLARHGIDFAVATLGTATTTEHLEPVVPPDRQRRSSASTATGRPQAGRLAGARNRCP